jgi:hypothetical protein
VLHRQVIDVQTRIKYLQNKKQEAIDYLNSKARDDPFVSFKDKPLQQSKKQKGHNEKKPGFCECCWAKYSDLDRVSLIGQNQHFMDNSIISMSYMISTKLLQIMMLITLI